MLSTICENILLRHGCRTRSACAPKTCQLALSCPMFRRGTAAPRNCFCYITTGCELYLEEQLMCKPEENCAATIHHLVQDEASGPPAESSQMLHTEQVIHYYFIIRAKLFS